MSTPTEIQPAQKLASAAIGIVWWYFLLRGLFLIIAGAFLVFKPGMSAAAFIQIIGAFMFVDGLLAIVTGFTGKTETRLWTILRGALVALIGWAVFSKPALVAGFAVSTLLYIIAAIVLVGGVLEVLAALKGKKSSSRKPSVFGGALLIAFGLLLLFAPLAFGILIVRIIGGVAILIGAILLFLALRTRKLRRQSD